VTAAAGAQAPATPASSRGRDRRSLWQPARDRFPARPGATHWPGAALPRAKAQRELARVLAGGRSARQGYARVGPGALLDWLEDQPGTTWQERWLASGADQAGTPGWRELPRRWLLERGRPPAYWLAGMSVAMRAAAAADIVRPSMHWLLGGGAANNHFTQALAAERDPAGFARLQGLLDADPELSAAARRVTVHRAAVIVAAKGGTLGEVTIGDLLAEYAAEDEALRSPCQGMQVIYGALRAMGVIDGPASFRQLRAAGPRTPEQMIDRYHLACRPVRDLLVDYLRERQPALDHSTLQNLGYELGKLFWADIEQHHPGIAGIHLPDDVARAWKQRLQVKDGSGGAAQAGTERISARHCLTVVRAFYLDIAQWALDDPSRWAQWAVPCPVRPQEITSRKTAQHRKSRMDARTRERLPVLPALASAIGRQRKDAAALLGAARQAQPGQEFTAAGRTLVRLPVRSGSPLKVWARDPATGERAELTVQESYAFWAWAATEVLRHTDAFSRGAKRICEAFFCFGCSGPWDVSPWVRQVWWNSRHGACGLDGRVGSGASAPACGGVDLGHELAVGCPCCGEFVAAFFELKAEVGGLLFEVGDLLAECVDVGGGAESGFSPGLLAEGFGEPFLELLDAGAEAGRAFVGGEQVGLQR